MGVLVLPTRLRRLIVAVAAAKFEWATAVLLEVNSWLKRLR
jgi:hypothetical protein